MTWLEMVEHFQGEGFTGDGYKIGPVQSWLKESGHSTETVANRDGETFNIHDAYCAHKINDKVDDRISAIEKATGISKVRGKPTRHHAHGVEMQHVKATLADDDDGPIEYKMWEPPPEKKDWDQLDTGGFGEGDDFRNARRLSMENAVWHDYARCIVESGKGNAKAQDRLQSLSVKQQQSEAIDSEGGFLAPAFHRASLDKTILDAQPWLGKLTRLTIGRKSVDLPRLDDRDRSSQEIAGFALADVAEGATIAADAIIIGLGSMELFKAAKVVYISNEVLSDSVPNIGLEVRDTIARAVRVKMGEDVMRGSGAGQPLGLLNSPGAYTLASRGGANLIAYATDILGMVERLEPALYNNAVWLCHNSTWPQLGILQITRGTDGIHVVWGANAEGSRPTSIMGFPLMITEVSSTLGTVGDIILVDLSAYIFVESIGGPVIDASSHARFLTDQEAIRVRHRRNGQIWRPQTLLDARNFESAQVVLLPA